ncbi:MAG: hypothetical protein AAF582_00045 [Pseudomonadota bacterium]
MSSVPVDPELAAMSPQAREGYYLALHRLETWAMRIKGAPAGSNACDMITITQGRQIREACDFAAGLSRAMQAGFSLPPST